LGLGSLVLGSMGILAKNATRLLENNIIATLACVRVVAGLSMPREAKHFRAGRVYPPIFGHQGQRDTPYRTSGTAGHSISDIRDSGTLHIGEGFYRLSLRLIFSLTGRLLDGDLH